MRCEDLTRELASPTGALSPAELAGHLAACPGCAEWSRQAARFDRIWEATRPLEPSADAMDILWAGAASALDEPLVGPAKLRFVGSARRQRWMKPAFVLAQAAAILVAALFLLRREGVEPVKLGGIKAPARMLTAPPVPVSLTVGIDQTAIVRIGKDDGHRVEIHDEAPSSMSSTIPEGTQHDLFNDLEIMAPGALDRVASR